MALLALFPSMTTVPVEPVIVRFLLMTSSPKVSVILVTVGSKVIVPFADETVIASLREQSPSMLHQWHYLQRFGLERSLSKQKLG